MSSPAPVSVPIQSIRSGAGINDVLDTFVVAVYIDVFTRHGIEHRNFAGKRFHAETLPGGLRQLGFGERGTEGRPGLKSDGSVLKNIHSLPAGKIPNSLLP
jgi:hypothetical protein